MIKMAFYDIKKLANSLFLCCFSNFLERDLEPLCIINICLNRYVGGYCITDQIPHCGKGISNLSTAKDIQLLGIIKSLKCTRR